MNFQIEIKNDFFKSKIVQTKIKNDQKSISIVQIGIEFANVRDKLTLVSIKTKIRIAAIRWQEGSKIGRQQNHQIFEKIQSSKNVEINFKNECEDY